MEVKALQDLGARISHIPDGVLVQKQVQKFTKTASKWPPVPRPSTGVWRN